VLRDYLRYVEGRRLEVGSTTGRDFDSDFERDVRARLEARGFAVDPQVGVAGYRIDLGVRHPIHPTIYLAGIECDGATFHSSKSARDRDRLRESVLRGKGWAILRVWSTDWFADADLQTDRLIAELQRLAGHPVQSRMDWTMVRASPSMQLGPADRHDLPKTEAPSFAAAPEDGGEPIIMVQGSNGAGLDEAGLDETEVKKRLRAFRDTEIIRDLPELDPERCILRDIMINKIVESRLDEPKDFTRKIPLWLRERTDQKQVKYLGKICSIVELL
jgi:very-short-patch-repair endonuclease